MIEKENAQNIFVIKNIISKKKTYKQKTNIYIRNDLREVIISWKVPGEHGLVWVIRDFY